MSTPFTDAAGIPVSEPTAVVTYSPVVLSVPGRPVDLQVKVSVPETGGDLPVILLSHGHGQSNFLSSLNGYGPVANFWAAHGFVVIQPTHLDSKALALDPDGPEGPLFWRSRATDMRFILDHLDEIEATVPGLAGRLDRSRIAAVGHSMGGHTVGLLSGQSLTDPVDGTKVDLAESRVKASVIMGGPGRGEDLAAFASEHYPIMRTTTFDGLTTQALIVNGEKDQNPMFSDRDDWRADSYYLSPGPKVLLTLFDAEHIFGGISGFDAAETTDENPERVGALRALVWAYLRTALYPEDPAWPAARAALEEMDDPPGRIESK